ncbi:hypothetical protein ACQU0X_28750 [Pseudovibrio ascidiaceicola]|uniref:hypothetical protein n=1 Tax=Pseudovibrio ascidiaceicola TaxID=285279 RepID=UPI003D36ADCC
MPVTISAVARECKVSRAAIRKAIERGRISVNSQGDIEDLEVAKQEFIQSRDVSKVRVTGPSQLKGTTKTKGGTSQSKGGTKPTGSTSTTGTPKTSSTSVAEVTDEHTELAKSFQKDKAESAAFDRKIKEMRFLKERGELLEKEAVVRGVTAMARTYKEAIVNFPTRYGPALASELGCDPQKLMAALERDLRATLQEVSDNKLSLPNNETLQPDL